MPGQNATAPSLKPHTMQGMHGLRVHEGNTAACAAGRRRACIGVFSCQGSCPVNSSHRITPYEYTARPAGLGAAAQRAPGTGRQPGCAHAGRLPHVDPATAPLFACQACCCSERAVHASRTACTHFDAHCQGHAGKAPGITTTTARAMPMRADAGRSDRRQAPGGQLTVALLIEALRGPSTLPSQTNQGEGSRSIA